MNGILKVVLSLSLSGSLLILLLLLLRPLYRGRLSRRWQYYIWLVVAARLLLPFAPETSLVGAVFQEIDRAAAQSETAPSPAPPGDAPAFLEDGAVGIREVPGDRAQQAQSAIHRAAGDPMALLWILWLVPALALMLRKITVYQSFVTYIRAGCNEVDDIALLEQFGKLAEQSGVKTPVELAVNSLVSSPLLLGFFRPCIVFPRADLPPVAFAYTVRHELTHCKRGDMFYKWLVQLCACVHWFNPLAWLMVREVERACELSCDEAVTKGLDLQGRRDYGNTLLYALEAGGKYQDSLSCAPLSGGGERLKERLDAIMDNRKKPKAMFGATVALTLAVCCCGVYAGAYREAPGSAAGQPAASGAPAPAPLPAPPVVSPRDFVPVGFSGVSVTGQGPVGVELVRTQEAAVSFVLLNLDDEERCTAKAELVDGTMRITVENDAPNGINVNFGPEYQNVIRVLIPDAAYERFEIQ